jgi:chromosome segregation ATPase
MKRDCDEHREAWRQADELEAQREALDAKVKAADRELSQHLDKVPHAAVAWRCVIDSGLLSLTLTHSQNTAKGLERVRKLMREEKTPGLHGPLIDLFTTDEKFYRCVETTAGSRSALHPLCSCFFVEPSHPSSLGCVVCFMWWWTLTPRPRA